MARWRPAISSRPIPGPPPPTPFQNCPFFYIPLLPPPPVAVFFSTQSGVSHPTLSSLFPLLHSCCCILPSWSERRRAILTGSTSSSFLPPFLSLSLSLRSSRPSDTSARPFLSRDLGSEPFLLHLKSPHVTWIRQFSPIELSPWHRPRTCRSSRTTHLTTGRALPQTMNSSLPMNWVAILVCRFRPKGASRRDPLGTNC